MSNFKNFWLSVPSDLYAKLKRCCSAAGTSIPVFVQVLLTKFAADPDKILSILDDHEK